MSVLYSNNAVSSLAAAITSTTATSLTVASGTGSLFPAASSPNVAYLTITNGSTIEIVQVTAVSGDTFTIVRAQDGTTAQTFPSGSAVALYITKAMLDQLKVDAVTGTTISTPETNYQVTTSVYPTVKPSLLLDFANTKTLDPRITFTRASTATYYDGSTVMAEQNLLTYSQDFTNAAWVKFAATVTGNATTAPDGTTTAGKIVEDTATSAHAIYQTFTSTGLTYTFTFYAKAAERSIIHTRGGLGLTYFNLSAGTVGTTAGGVTASIVSAGNGWYRCVCTGTITSGATNVQIGPSTADGTDSYTGDGTSGIYLWGAQLEQRSSATVYTATTTSPITNYIPVLKTAAANTPRFDVNPTTGESLGLLIEEQRTNLLTYSSAFENAIWATSNLTITPNAGVAPDGTLTARLLQPATTSGQHFTNQNQITSGTTTFSVYAKYAGYQWLGLSDSQGAFTTFDILNGAVGTPGSGVTASIQSVGNGWYRCSVTQTYVGQTSYIFIENSNAQATYAGNGYSGILIWGAQLESGSFATSYIPTVASQVTRSADSASMTGTNFSSWYNAAQFTCYCEATRNGSDPAKGNGVFSFFNASTSALSNSMLMDCESPIAFYGNNSGTVQFNIAFGNNTPLTYTKLAGSYSTNLAQAAANGSSGTVDTSALLPAFTGAVIGAYPNGISNFLNGTIKRLSYYPIALTSAQLQALTTI